MHAKAEADKAGRLHEPSVVQTSRARLFGGIDNATIGLVYYPAVLIGSFFMALPAVRWCVLGAALVAVIVSIYLAYSLLVVTKMQCPNCMLAHAMNIAILGAVLYLAHQY